MRDVSAVFVHLIHSANPIRHPIVPALPIDSGHGAVLNMTAVNRNLVIMAVHVFQVHNWMKCSDGVTTTIMGLDVNGKMRRFGCRSMAMEPILLL